MGTLTLNNTVSYGSDSIFEWNLQAVATTDPGAVADASTGTYDKVVLNGGANSVTGDSSVFNIVLGGNTFSDPFWNTNKRWTDLFTGTGTPSDLSAIFTTFAGSGINPNGTVTGNAGHFSFNDSSTLTWSAVPEPSNTALTVVLLGAGLLHRSRPATAGGHGG